MALAGPMSLSADTAVLSINWQVRRVQPWYGRLPENDASKRLLRSVRCR